MAVLGEKKQTLNDDKHERKTRGNKMHTLYSKWGIKVF